MNNPAKDINYRSPMYIQLREILRSKIQNGESLPGEAIPSENELCELYGLHRMTVRNAISALVEEGLLKRVQGKGVYVIGNKLEHKSDTINGFTQTIHRKKSIPNTKVLFRVTRQAGDKYADILKINKEDWIYYIRRVHSADDEPVSFEDLYIPYNTIPELEKVDLGVFSIDEAYSFYDITVSSALQTLSLSILDAKDARILKIKPEMTVLLFESTGFDKSGKVVEFTRTYTRGDKCSFKVQYFKNPQEENTKSITVIKPAGAKSYRSKGE